MNIQWNNSIVWQKSNKIPGLFMGDASYHDQIKKFHARILAYIRSSSAEFRLFSGPRSVQFHIGLPLLAHVLAVRQKLASGTLLIYLHQDDLDQPLVSDRIPDTMALSMNRMPFEDCVGMAVTLLYLEDIRISVSTELEKRFGDEIARLNDAISRASGNLKMDANLTAVALRISMTNSFKSFDPGTFSFAKFNRNMPVVVCGAGPSLKNEIPLIIEKRDSIILCAVGHAVSSLLRNGLHPDFVMEADSVSHVNWKHGLIPDSVFVGLFNVSPYLPGEFSRRIWVKGDSPFATAFLKQNGIPVKEVFISRSVMVGAIDFSVKCGARKIILVGSDLCRSESGALHVDSNSKEIPGRLGGTVISDPSLISIWRALQDYLKGLRSDIASLEIINSSSRGALIEGTSNQSLSEALADACPPSQGAVSYELLALPQGLSPDYMKRLYAGSSEALGVLCSALNSSVDAFKRAVSTASDPCEIESLSQQYFKRILPVDARIAPLFEAMDLQALLLLPRIGDCMKFFTDNPLMRAINMAVKDDILLSLLTDLKNDMELMLSGKEATPFYFTGFRNLFIDKISSSNPEFADALKHRIFSLDGTFDLFYNYTWPYPLISKLEGNSKIVLSSYVGMMRETELVLDEFCRSNNYNPETDAVIMYAPGHYAFPVDFFKRYPAAEMMIVEPRPELLSDQLDAVPGPAQLPSGVTFVAIHESLKNWRRIYSRTAAGWKRSGKRILFLINKRFVDADPQSREKFDALPSLDF